MSSHNIGTGTILYDMHNFPFRIDDYFPIVTHGGYEYISYYNYSASKPMQLRYETDHAVVGLLLKSTQIAGYHIFFNYDKCGGGYYDI